MDQTLSQDLKTFALIKACIKMSKKKKEVKSFTKRLQLDLESILITFCVLRKVNSINPD